MQETDRNLFIHLSTMSRVWAFYNHGRKHFNRRGWLAAKPLPLEDVNLSGKVFVITGANSGIGKMLTGYLFSKGAKVYMVCRDEGRGLAAKAEIEEGPDTFGSLEVLIGDCAVASDVKRLVLELEGKEAAIDGLVCNAGALLNSKNMTSENVESTFACHFLNGTYLFGQLAMPLLSRSSAGRVIVVTSGGMYTSKLAPWNLCMSGGDQYDGQVAYARAKRAQVTLCEVWKDKFDATVPTVSCHPGWCLTPGVKSVYGTIGQWFLSPLRSEWEGTAGIAWLCVCPISDLSNGELYLDGVTQPKHLHNSTKPSDDDVEHFVTSLKNIALH